MNFSVEFTFKIQIKKQLLYVIFRIAYFLFSRFKLRHKVLALLLNIRLLLDECFKSVNDALIDFLS
jgi:hypothetical protein